MCIHAMYVWSSMLLHPSLCIYALYVCVCVRVVCVCVCVMYVDPSLTLCVYIHVYVVSQSILLKAEHYKYNYPKSHGFLQCAPHGNHALYLW